MVLITENEHGREKRKHTKFSIKDCLLAIEADMNYLIQKTRRDTKQEILERKSIKEDICGDSILFDKCKPFIHSHDDSLVGDYRKIVYLVVDKTIEKLNQEAK